MRLSSASANRQLSQPKIFPSPGAAWPRGFFCGRRGVRGAWPPTPLSACALWRAFAGPCRRGGTAGCAVPCFCAKLCRGASLFGQAPLFLMRVSDISFPALLERVKRFRSKCQAKGEKSGNFAIVKIFKQKNRARCPGPCQLPARESGLSERELLENHQC